jgi:hypothetical protein
MLYTDFEVIGLVLTLKDISLFIRGHSLERFALVENVGFDCVMGSSN